MAEFLTANNTKHTKKRVVAWFEFGGSVAAAPPGGAAAPPPPG